MLIKEYRISLPLSVDEYRIAQLYMIQKKSREESSGAGSGVEILINEPYTDGPGGNGQYTHKIYHIGSHLPGWFRSILPKSALRVEEEAWNAYPYTKTIYRCPFIEKFTLEIETVYLNDGGEQENVFNLPDSVLRNRVVDYIDIVQDPVSGGDYSKEEDPKLYRSEKTGRGPLTESWRKDYIKACKDPGNKDKAIMCAYKLCKVEFRYWGMQTKIERFIHDIGLRKTMVRAHRQAWCWQDEYYGLTMEDIRRLERQTQEALQQKMAQVTEEDGEDSNDKNANTGSSPTPATEPPKLLERQESRDADVVIPVNLQNAVNTAKEEAPHSAKVSVGPPPTHPYGSRLSMNSVSSGRRQSWGSVRSRVSAAGSSRSLTGWRGVESLEQIHVCGSDTDDEYFDAQEDLMSEHGGSRAAVATGLYRSSSMEILTPDDEYQDSFPSPSPTNLHSGEVFSPLDRRLEQYRSMQSNTLDPASITSPGPLPQTTAAHSCKTTILFLVLHGGSVMDMGQDPQLSKQSDISTMRTTLDTVVRAHYPAMYGHIALRMVPCPAVCSEALTLLSSLNPFSFDVGSPAAETSVITNANFPLSVVSLFAMGAPEYLDSVVQVIAKANSVYNDFLRSDEGLGFNGQVCLIGDSVGSILGYDALCKNNPYLSRHASLAENESAQDDNGHTVVEARRSNLETIKQASHSNPDLTVTDSNETEIIIKEEKAYTSSSSSSSQTNRQDCRNSSSTRPFQRFASCPNSRRTSTGSQSDCGKFEFDVSDFFMFGSPLGMVLAYRKFTLGEDRTLSPPQYLDPLAAAIGHEFYKQTRQQMQNDCLPRPSCHQIYNMFYASDPLAVRVEPLLQDKFKQVPPMKVPRYQKFPLGDGQSVHVVETIQSHSEVFLEGVGSPRSPLQERRQSNLSIVSEMSGQFEPLSANIASLISKWWGNKRVDFTLYCPEGLQSFPTVALPYLLHASFWESTDVASFILRQVVRQDYVAMQSDSGMVREASLFTPTQPREKWLKRRTTIKLRNVAPNHRANDVILLEDRPQQLSARFMYGPLDMVSLSGEKVDIHIMTSPPTGDYIFFDTEISDSNGRVTYSIPNEKRLVQGMYPVKMVVRGDHTCVDFNLAILPPKTETVVFSIDGSFTASVSIMGKDPKVRAGAVDVVRHWQELGFLILYITARPDMQQKRVVAWLAQHNFPHGMVAFMDGLSADPLRQKANYLKHLKLEAGIEIHAAYGSSKDISVYSAVGMLPDQIFIVGKASKRNQKEANVISEGYAAHLSELCASALSRPAQGNARMFLRKSCFSLPGQHRTGSKKPVRKTASLPQRGVNREASKKASLPDGAVGIGISESGNTVVSAGAGMGPTAARQRGFSPRPKLTPRFDSSEV